MNKINYQKELDKILEETDRSILSGNEPPSLFLHSCCAPCSSYVLEYLGEHFRITDFFYNPNIEPETEYRYREKELQRLISEMDTRYPVTFLPGFYAPAMWHRHVKGLEGEPEGGERCTVCFRVRLEEAARLAVEGGYDFFTTTLTISPLKDAERLNRIGQEMAEKYGVRFLPSDFKKKNGYLRSTQLSGEHHLYRQDYCGCVYSKLERERQKQQVK